MGADTVHAVEQSLAFAVEIPFDSKRRKFIGDHSHLPARSVRAASVAAILQNFRRRFRFIAITKGTNSRSRNFDALPQKIRGALGTVGRNDDPSSRDGGFP